MKGNKAGCADHESRALRPVEVSCRRGDRDGVAIRSQDLRKALGDGVDSLRPELWPGADQRQVSTVNQPTRVRCLDTASLSKSALSIPFVRGSSAGKRRPRSPRPAADRTAEAAACKTTSPSEWPYRRGAVAMTMPPRRRPFSGPKPCVSWPRPKRVAALGDASAGCLAAAIARTMSRSDCSVTFRLVASPGTVATLMPRLSRSAASSV